MVRTKAQTRRGSGRTYPRRGLQPPAPAPVPPQPQSPPPADSSEPTVQGPRRQEDRQIGDPRVEIQELWKTGENMREVLNDQDERLQYLHTRQMRIKAKAAQLRCLLKACAESVATLCSDDEQ